MSTHSSIGRTFGPTSSIFRYLPFALGAVSALCLAFTAPEGRAEGGSPPLLTVTSPIERIVYQRDLSNRVMVPVLGTCPAGAEKVEAHLVPLDGHPASPRWVVVDPAPAGGHFKGQLPAIGGWYKLEVKATDAKGATATGSVAHFGVGEVFVIAGHSVAHGGDINIEGSADERVSAVPTPEKTSEQFLKYEATGDPKLMPPPVFVQYVDGVRPAPVGRGTYFWAKFGEDFVKKYDVPVLLYNASFGGTSLEHWAKSASGEQFEHSFVKSKIGMPHTNVYNTLMYYIPLTGMRAMLCDHAQNDWTNEDENQILGYYKTWIARVRKDLNFDIAVVANRQTPFGKAHIRRVQERIVKEYPNVYTGADYDTFAKEDTVDGIHLAAPGQEKAAQMWTDALDENFMKNAKPYTPPLKQPPLVK